MDWIQAVGFQKEALHVGVLKCMLDQPTGAEVARALASNDSISGVDHVETEVRINGAKRPIDLGALVMVGDHTAWIGVECKVDSAWSATQLRETLPEGLAGILLAVGHTALAVEDEDMEAIDQVPWRCVRPDEFAAIVRDHAGDDADLLGYAECLDREAREHERARAAAYSGEQVVSGRGGAEALGHWAYFSEVLRRGKTQAQHWERKSLISGPLMTLWVNQGDTEGDYLEFMGEGGRRSLCVKTYAPPGALPVRRERLVELLTDHPYKPETPRHPGARRKTCTAARFPLDGIPPEKAAGLVDDLLTTMAHP